MTVNGKDSSGNTTTLTATKLISVYAVIKNKNDGNSLYTFTSVSGTSCANQNTAYRTYLSYYFLGLRVGDSNYKIYGGSQSVVTQLFSSSTYKFLNFPSSLSSYTKIGDYYLYKSGTMCLKATIGGSYYVTVNGIK